MIGGIPNISHNEGIVRELNYHETWGTYNVMQILPPIEEVQAQLKPLRYCALLESNCINPNDMVHDGSMLIVIWYGDQPNFKPIEKLLEDSLKNIKWDENANNYSI